MEERNYIKEFIEAMKKGDGFNFLLEEGYNIRKFDLLDMLKELTYAVEDQLLPCEKEDVVNTMEENLSQEEE